MVRTSLAKVNWRGRSTADRPGPDEADRVMRLELARLLMGHQLVQGGQVHRAPVGHRFGQLDHPDIVGVAARPGGGVPAGHPMHHGRGVGDGPLEGHVGGGPVRDPEDEEAVVRGDENRGRGEEAAAPCLEVPSLSRCTSEPTLRCSVSTVPLTMACAGDAP